MEFPYPLPSRGWRAGVIGFAMLVAPILFINVTFTIWAVARYGVVHGIGTFYEGGCKQSRNLITWVELLVNILSSGMLAGSNYCMSLPFSLFQKTQTKLIHMKLHVCSD